MILVKKRRTKLDAGVSPASNPPRGIMKCCSRATKLDQTSDTTSKTTTIVSSSSKTWPQLSRSTRVGTSGTAALEFAIVAPVLLLMSLGMIVFGLYFVYDQVLLDVTASATRASVAGLTAAERDSLARQFISQYVAASSLLKSSDLTVTTNSIGSPPNTYSVTTTYSLQDTAIPSLASITSLNVSNITCTYTILFGGY